MRLNFAAIDASSVGPPTGTAVSRSPCVTRETACSSARAGRTTRRPSWIAAMTMSARASVSSTAALMSTRVRSVVAA